MPTGTSLQVSTLPVSQSVCFLSGHAIHLCVFLTLVHRLYIHFAFENFTSNCACRTVDITNGGQEQGIRWVRAGSGQVFDFWGLPLGFTWCLALLKMSNVLLRCGSGISKGNVTCGAWRLSLMEIVASSSN